MVRFCTNCGTQNTNKKAIFCTNCGSRLPSHTPTSNKQENEIKKTSVLDLIELFSIGAVVIVILLFIAGTVSSGKTNPTPYLIDLEQGGENPVASSIETPQQKNVRICQETVQQYHSTHSYYTNDIFDCDNMASDVWDMIKANGINAKIEVGRIDYPPKTITDANHAWVLAEVAPDNWVALETTSGELITDNPRYFSGWSFNNPKQLRDYETLLKQYNDAIVKYTQAQNEYNSLVDQYNSANLLTRISLSSSINTKSAILNQRTQDVNEITQKISFLLDANS